MKKVTITIKTERTFEVQFNEQMLNEEWIQNWNEHIFCINGEPKWMMWPEQERVNESDYPFLNLAESVAFALHENQDDRVEMLRFQNITENELFEVKKDPSYPVHYKRIGRLETEYEVDWDNTDLTPIG